MPTIRGSYGPYSDSGQMLHHTYVVPADGEYSIAHSMFGGDEGFSAADIYVNSSRAAAGSPSTRAGGVTVSTAEITGNYVAGTIIEMRSWSNWDGAMISGEWSVFSTAIPRNLPDNAFSPDEVHGIYQGDVEADAFYVGSTEVWPLEPRLIHEAKFDPSAISLYSNTGRTGGVFSPRPPLVQARSPYGAYFPAAAGMFAPVKKSHWGYTLAGWVKSSAPREDAVVMSLGDVWNSSVGFLNIIHSSDATRRVYLLARHGGVRPPSIVAPNYAGIGTWLHVAATLEYLPAGAVVKFYVNGALIGTQALEVAGEYMKNMTLDLGGDWEGDMGLVHFYDRPLDLAGIRGIYNDERGIYGLPENPGVGNPLQWHDPDVWMAFDKDLLTNRGSVPANAAYFSTPNPTRSIIGGQAVGVFTGGTIQVPISNRPWTNGGTIACWFQHRAGNTNGGKGIIHRGPTGSIRWELYLNMDPATGRLYAGTKIDDVWWDVALPANAPSLSDGGWHYIAATVGNDIFNPARWTLYVYADGRISSAARLNLPATGAFPNDGLLIGGTRDGSRYRANLDDVIAVSRPLSISELNTIRDYGREDPY